MVRDEVFSMVNDYEHVYYERKLIETYLEECRQHHSAEKGTESVSSPKFLIAQWNAEGDESSLIYGDLKDFETPKLCEFTLAY